MKSLVKAHRPRREDSWMRVSSTRMTFVFWIKHFAVVRGHDPRTHEKLALDQEGLAGSVRMDSPDKPGSDDFIYNQILTVIAALVAAIHGRVPASHRFCVT